MTEKLGADPGLRGLAEQTEISFAHDRLDALVSDIRAKVLRPDDKDAGSFWSWRADCWADRIEQVRDDLFKLLAAGQASAVPPSQELEREIVNARAEVHAANMRDDWLENFVEDTMRLAFKYGAEASGVPASPQWLPIESAPAEEQTPVLCWTPHTMAVAYFDNGDWWILGSRSVIEATHWMPLPDPPGATDTPKS